MAATGASIDEIGFQFQGRQLNRTAPGRRIDAVPEALDVTCPCCGSLMKVDAETGAVVWTERKKEAARNFDELVDRVHSQKSQLDERFERSVRQNQHQRDILDRKFEEARKRAASDPGRPPHPFDND
jgi:adenine-specific DNA methylase